MTEKRIRWDFMVALADTIVKADSPIRMGMNEERVSHAVAISALLTDHSIPSEMVESLCYATDDPVKVLALVSQGLPTDYILALGGV